MYYIVCVMMCRCVRISVLFSASECKGLYEGGQGQVKLLCADCAAEQN